MRGRFHGVSGDQLLVRLDENGHIDTPINLADVAFVARLVGESKIKRGWIGAAIGVVVSLPLSVSVVGDMMIPAALAGAAIGRSTGDARAEIVYERKPVPLLPDDPQSR